MGTWGTGVLQNDTSSDIWADFKKLYNKGLSSKQIRLELEKQYKPQTDTENYGEIWTGIAYGQWMCGDVEDYTFKKLNDATKLKWLTLWIEDKRLLEKRINVITDFIEKIKTPRPNPLKRKKVVERPLIYKKGDIIAQKIDEVNYLVAIVVEASDHPNYLEYTLVLTDLLFIEKPTQEQILNSNILYLDIGGDSNYHRGFYRATFTTKNMVKKAKQTVKIGEFEIKKYLGLGIGTGVGDWNNIPVLYYEQIEFLKQNQTDKPFNVTVKCLLNPQQELQNKLYEWSKKIFREKMVTFQQNAT
jgi:hypothetical protein